MINRRGARIEAFRRCLARIEALRRRLLLAGDGLQRRGSDEAAEAARDGVLRVRLYDIKAALYTLYRLHMVYDMLRAHIHSPYFVC